MNQAIHANFIFHTATIFSLLSEHIVAFHLYVCWQAGWLCSPMHVIIFSQKKKRSSLLQSRAKIRAGCLSPESAKVTCTH